MLQSLDVSLFRFVNSTLQNPFFDVVMPVLSGNAIFYPLLVLAGIYGLWKGDRNTRIWVVLLVLIVPLGDSYICNTIKHEVARLRPFAALPDVHQLVSAGRDNSMPSSHAANWAAGTMISFLFFRRSWRYLLPLGGLVSFSRIYNGVHYPSDVLAGWALGAGYGFGIVCGLNALWLWAGPKWFPLWWKGFPSLLPKPGRATSSVNVRPVSADAHWLHLGYFFIGALLLVRWAYIASGIIELSEDEAYQWLWSKRLALGYYSKPPMIAYTQWLGTHLWGDNFFGVRFFAPVAGAVLGFLLLRLFAREFSARLGFCFLLVITATPLLAVGGTLMTVDPLSVLFWTLAMLAGWRAIQEKSTLADWFWVGLWMGLGFLSKYTALLQWLCWACVFLFIPAARRQLRRPGVYLALGVNLLCFTPVMLWNAQHGWISLVHTAERGNLDDAWQPTLRYVIDFLGAEAVLLNPIFFVASLWAMGTWWSRRKANPLLTYLMCMGAPLFLCYFLWTFHSRVLPNWIAPAILPMLCVMVIYWQERWQQGVRAVTGWLKLGLGLGFIIVVLAHDTGLIRKITGYTLPARLDETSRLQGWEKTAAIVADARERLLAEGQPVFVIGGHYGISGQMAFNLADARPLVSAPEPLVYYRTSTKPRNQFYFWPGYSGQRTGQNAIYVERLSDRTDRPVPPAPPDLVSEFESVTNLGTFDIRDGGRVVRRIQVFACRGLR